MFRSIVLLVAGLASLSAVSLSAQEAILGQKYGYGVQAYFSGDYVKAYEQLTAAIDGGSTDPRAFYFRGLAYLRLGRAQEATQDFKKGATFESKDASRFYNVSKALERVQGLARVDLETYRVEARMAALEEGERLRKSRYEAIQAEESRVLSQEPLTPPEPEAAAETVETPASETAVEAVEEPAAKATEGDPFGATEEGAASKAEKRPAANSKKAAVVPAADESGEAPATADETETPAAGDDPFAAPATEAAEKGEAAEPAAEKKTTAKEEPADASNPFQEEPAADEKPAADEEPAVDEKPAAADEEPAVEEKPAKSEKSAKKTPAKKGDASDDPFAE